MACLTRGRAASGAEWRQVAPTTDGDPITTYYRVFPGTPEVEIFLDRSRDTHQQGDGWKQLNCTVSDITPANMQTCLNSV